MSATLLEQYAEHYWKFGWNLLPLFNYSKDPSSGYKYHPDYWQDPSSSNISGKAVDGWEKKKGWTPFKTARQKEFYYKKWINDPELTGIGVVTGAVSNITVVDEDNYKEGGKTFNVASPLISRTTSGGRHHYFKYNENIATTGLKKGVFIEIKSKGGFIVLPPSLVYNKEKEIKAYKWISDKVKNIEDLPTLEQGAIAYLTPPKTEVKRTVLSELLNVDIGDQHHSLRTYANSQLATHKEEDWPFVYTTIREAAKTYNPPHPENRVEKILQDCTNFIRRKREEKKTENDTPQSMQAIVRQRIADKEIEKEAASTGYKGLDKILRGLIPGRLYCVSGLSNVGKTTICSNFSVRIAAQGKRVLYLALEPGVNLVDYLASAGENKDFIDVTNDDLYNISPNIEVYTKEQILTLQDMINLITKLDRYDLIIIDHLGYFITGASAAGPIQEQENAVKRLVTLAQQKKTAVMFIVHMRKKPGSFKSKKGETTMPTMDDLKGSSALYQDATDVIFVTRAVAEDGVTQEGDGKMIVVKTKSGKNGVVPIYFKDGSARIDELDVASANMF